MCAEEGVTQTARRVLQRSLDEKSHFSLIACRPGIPPSRQTGAGLHLRLRAVFSRFTGDIGRLTNLKKGSSRFTGERGLDLQKEIGGGGGGGGKELVD